MEFSTGPEHPIMRIVENLGAINLDSDKPEEAICKLLSSTGDWDNLQQKSVRSVVLRFDSQLVVKILEGTRWPGDALEFFRWLHQFGLFKHNRQTYGKMIEILVRAGMMAEATKICMDMPAESGVSWDEDLLVMILKGYEHRGPNEESITLFESMKKAGVVQTSRPYDSLFHVLLSNEQPDVADMYFNQMLGEGIKPTCNTFRELIRGYFSLLKRLDKAEAYFQLMKEQAGISPDVSTYNAMIRGYGYLKKIEEAERMFAEMQESGLAPNDATYTELINGLVYVSRLDDALDLYDEMNNAGIQPNKDTYFFLLHGLCDAEYIPEAMELIEDMEKKHIIPPYMPPIFLKVMTFFCESGEVHLAVEALKSMDKLSVPAGVAHYVALIDTYCESQDYDSALKYLDELFEKEIIVKSVDCSDHEPIVDSPIISYLCSNGHTDKAETIFYQLSRHGDTYIELAREVISGLEKEGSPDRATKLAEYMDERCPRWKEYC